MSRALGLAAVALALSGCAIIRARNCPDWFGYPWYEVRTRHFVILTNVDRGEARRVAQLLESQREALATFLGVNPDAVAEVVHFRNRVGFEQFQPGAISGFAAVTQKGPFLVELEMERGDRPLSESLSRSPPHEIAHQLDAFVHVRSPRWFKEGMATYLETVSLSGDAAILGRPPRELVPLLGDGPATLDRLFAWGAVRGTADERPLYAASWAWVHFLSDRHRAELSEFSRRLAAAEDPRSAFDAAFRAMDRARLEKDFLAYLSRGSVATFVVHISSAPAEPQLRPLRDAEVHALFAKLWLLTPGEGDRSERRSEARRQIAQALEKEARDPGARLLQVELEDPGSDARGAAAEAYERDFPETASAFVFAAERAAKRGAGDQALEALRRAAALAPEDPHVLNNLAWGLYQAHRAAEGLPFAEIAVRRAPWCIPCVDTLAHVQAAAGRCPDALVTEHRAIDLLPEGTPAESRQRYSEALEALENDCMLQ